VGVDERDHAIGAAGQSPTPIGLFSHGWSIPTSSPVQSSAPSSHKVTATISVAFGCPFEGHVDPGIVIEHANRMAQAGADEIILADTIGVGVPKQVTHLVPEALKAGKPVGVHFHNTRNTGYANALAAVQAGVSVLDASAGGIGGCPFAPGATGNVATEDLLYLLHRSGYTTGVDPTPVAETGAWVSDQLGLSQAPAQLGRAGWFPSRGR
jgi:isopropylmalate/homocitrate/citramalate synthase